MSCSITPMFGKYMKIITSYDGIFLVGLNTKNNILYIYENGDSNAKPPIPFRYWSIDFNNNLDLLDKVLSGQIEVYDLIINGKVPAHIIRVVDFEYGQEFYNYLQIEDNKYIPHMVGKDMKYFFHRPEK